MQKLEHQQHDVEEVVSKESRVLQYRVDPSTVDEPKTQQRGWGGEWKTPAGSEELSEVQTEKRSGRSPVMFC